MVRTMMIMIVRRGRGKEKRRNSKHMARLWYLHFLRFNFLILIMSFKS